MISCISLDLLYTQYLRYTSYLDNFIMGSCICSYIFDMIHSQLVEHTHTHTQLYIYKGQHLYKEKNYVIHLFKMPPKKITCGVTCGQLRPSIISPPPLPPSLREQFERISYVEHKAYYYNPSYIHKPHLYGPSRHHWSSFAKCTSQ